MKMTIQKRDQAGFLFIRNHFIDTGLMPSLRTIAAEIGYKSPRSVQLMLKRLSKNGLVFYSDGKIELVHNPGASTGERTVDVSVVGSVACGTLMLAEEVAGSVVKVSTKLARPGHKYFILKAIGDSMNKSEINDGDLLLVRQQPNANEGERVVALVNDEATIKHFHRKDGVVILRPNSTDKTIKPIILSVEFIIQGVVVQTIPDPF